MSIRIKLLLSYSIMIIISAIILVFSGFAIVTSVISNTAEAVITEESYQVAFVELIDLMAEIKQAEDYEPEKLIDEKFLKELNTKNEFYRGGIIVNYNNVFYNFDGLPKTEDFYEKVKQTSFNHENSPQKENWDDEVNGHENMIIVHGEKKYFAMKQNYKVGHEEVDYYFVVDVTRTKTVGSNVGKKILSTLGIVLLIILMPLALIISYDIMKPIKKLEYGVKQIKAGNLDFELRTNKKNELGKIVKSFEKMRIELKSSIDKQLKFEENRKELLSSISHDLKTPVTSIKGHIEGIRDGVANTPEKLYKYHRVIYQQAKDMDQLIDDLFLFSKLDLNKMPFDLKEVNLIQIMKEIIDQLKLEWENDHNDIQFISNLKITEKPLVLIDAQQIKRVVVNIIKNSMKFINKEEQKIEIRVNDDGAYYQIVISDNGMGIEREHLDKIFEKFYRVEASRNLDTGGSGLGLAISKEIIEQHNGSIYASSVINEGTKIIIGLKKASTRNEEVKFHE